MTTTVGSVTSYSDPHVQFLSQILLDIRRGELLVPRFQRPFVWTEQQQLELLRSLRDGIPIGAIMVWRTSNAPISCYNELGPFQLQKSDRFGSHDYLLDGVQRLSTLYGALTPLSGPVGELADASGDGELQQVPLRAHFDLRELDFLFVRPEASALPHQVPLSILLDSLALLRFQRNLESLEDGERLIVESDRLAGAYRQYKLPVIPIATDDLGLATLTFQRINSQGQKMSDYHMLHALTWSPNFDLMQQLDALRSEHLAPVGWEALDEDPILKTVKLLFDYDVYKADIHDLSKAVRQNPVALETAVLSIATAAKYLQSALAIPTFEFVPYTLQIVLLADVFRRNPEESTLSSDLLANWFWFVTYSEAFSGISDDKLRNAHADLLRTLKTRTPCWSLKTRYVRYSPPERYDSRAVKTKSLILTMARTQQNTVGTETATATLAEYGRRGIAQAYPASAFPLELRHLAYSFGNRVIVSPPMLTRLRKALSEQSPEAVSWLLQTDSGFQEPAEVVAKRERLLLQADEEFASRTAAKFWVPT